jgi:hypothetical protein
MLSPKRLEIAPLAPSPLPVDLPLIKAHCAIDGPDFDVLPTTYLMAAIAWAEGVMHRTIFARAHSWVLRDFPPGRGDEITLPRGKTQSIEGIDYEQIGEGRTLRGASSSPAGTDYREDLRGDDGGVVVPGGGEVWPAADSSDAAAPVVVRFTAGWLAGAVPQDITCVALRCLRCVRDPRRSRYGGGAEFRDTGSVDQRASPDEVLHMRLERKSTIFLFP